MDELSVARGLAYGLIETWTNAAHELGEGLFRGECGAVEDFDGLCAELRKEN